MKRGLLGGNLPGVTEGSRPKEAHGTVARRVGSVTASSGRVPAGPHGATIQVIQAPPDVDGLRGLARQVASFGGPVHAAVESMNGARFVPDQLELAGFKVAIADAAKVKGLAPLAGKPDRIDARVLPRAVQTRPGRASSGCRPRGARRAGAGPPCGCTRVRHRTSLKNRIHATLLAVGIPARSGDLAGR
jgi:transposase